MLRRNFFSYTRIYIYIHTYIHTYTHTYVHVYTRRGIKKCNANARLFGIARFHRVEFYESRITNYLLGLVLNFIPLLNFVLIHITVVIWEFYNIYLSVRSYNHTCVRDPHCNTSIYNPSLRLMHVTRVNSEK